MKIQSETALRLLGLLLVAVGCVMLAIASILMLWGSAREFLIGFLHGFSVVANLTGLVLLVRAWRKETEGGRQKAEESLS